MKRDWGLVRGVLETVEAFVPHGNNEYLTVSELKVEGHSGSRTRYHALLCMEAGFIKSGPAFVGGPNVIWGLTWEGYDLLEMLRDGATQRQPG